MALAANMNPVIGCQQGRFRGRVESMESTIATREGRSERSKRTHLIRSVHWVRWVGGLLVVLGLAGAGLFIVSKATTEYLYWSRILAWKDARFDDFATKFPARS